MEFLLDDYNSRQDLEEDIRIQTGQDIAVNREGGHVVKGSKKQMEKFHLSEETEIYGCKCQLTYGTKRKKEKDTA